MNTGRWAILLLVMAQLLWAGNFITGRYMSGEIAPLTLAFSRWSVALVCLLPIGGPVLWRQWPLVRPLLGRMIVLGLLGVSAFNTLLYYGLQTTPATNAALLNSFIPVLIIALSFLLYRERIRRLQVLGIVISLAGVLVLLSRGELARLIGLSLNHGDLWILGAVVVWSFYSIWLRWKPKDLKPLSFAMLSILVGEVVLGLLFFSLPAEYGTTPLALTPGNIIAVLYTGIPVSIIAFLCWNEGVKQVGAALAGQFIHLLPVFGAAMAVIFLGEQPQLYHLIGAVLIAIGVWLSVRKKRRPIEMEPSH